MFQVLYAVFNYALGWLVRGAVIKFVILSAVYYVVTFIADAVFGRLDISAMSGLQTAFSSLPESTLYFMGVFRLDVGIPLILGAMLTAFIIRRLPFIG